MSHLNTRPSDADQGFQPALPPFAGPARPRPDAPLRRAVRRVGARPTLPPFFMPAVTVGGPLPGVRNAALSLRVPSSYEAPSPEVVAQVAAAAHAEPAVEARFVGLVHRGDRKHFRGGLDDEFSFATVPCDPARAHE